MIISVVSVNRVGQGNLSRQGNLSERETKLQKKRKGYNFGDQNCINPRYTVNVCVGRVQNLASHVRILGRKRADIDAQEICTLHAKLAKVFFKEISCVQKHVIATLLQHNEFTC